MRSSQAAARRPERFALKAEGGGEAQPKFEMVVGATFLVDEVFEQQLTRFEIVAA